MDRGRGARSRAHEFCSASVESPHPCALWYTEPPSPRQPRWPREQPRWSREHSARSGAHISCRGAGRFLARSGFACGSSVGAAATPLSSRRAAPPPGRSPARAGPAWMSRSPCHAAASAGASRGKRRARARRSEAAAPSRQKGTSGLLAARAAARARAAIWRAVGGAFPPSATGVARLAAEGAHEAAA